MAKAVLTLEGMERTQAALRRAPELVRVHASSAVGASTFAVAQRARALVPVDTGLLKSSIESSNVVSGLSGRVGVTAAAYYWRFIEFGTVKRGARPFFRPAAEEEQNAFVQRMREIGPKVERDLSGGRFV